jgi:hypothetical protein
MADRYDVMVVEEGKDGGKSFFTKVGVMFANKDGRGFNIYLKAQSLDGKYVVREPLPKRDDDGARF